MSRIGKLPIEIPAGTQVKIEKGFVVVKGPKGELSEKVNQFAKLEITEKEVLVSVENPEVKKERSVWGLFRTLISNMIIGVNQGYEKKLEVNGVGYRAAVNGSVLTVNAGYSHPVEFKLAEGITASVAANVITISGINKYLVGETAAQIRKIRKPEPYKGKGIKYVDEVIRRKAGKTSAKGDK
ncbi:MAG: 50S ribosomal protein L6 [Parcubacteria group bacterium GW2011_GWE2_39_37]|uniref:Large ribosomal subunit protein uL6 n=1 Tax=Candidatus Falkowbacteria bacterium GW2011_GWF2_39_8 TaxID=1618642 RepID=A0A0G0T281_9BACT|nr:MAG: 50S ribosomal protein L6 [Parcubacteria group bacterium GW2011_GWE2_39_37]KKR31957.1 MAG: 50S ribosomal protein L6 [Candidatus Falkowbacteria bacterium GW2011_GWF2_39_8]